MWLNKGTKYAYYIHGCVVYFESGICGKPISGLSVSILLKQNWGFTTGTIPLMYTNWVKDNMV